MSHFTLTCKWWRIVLWVSRLVLLGWVLNININALVFVFMTRTRIIISASAGLQRYRRSKNIAWPCFVYREIPAILGIKNHPKIEKNKLMYIFWKKLLTWYSKVFIIFQVVNNIQKIVFPFEIRDKQMMPALVLESVVQCLHIGSKESRSVPALALERVVQCLYWLQIDLFIDCIILDIEEVVQCFHWL